MHLTFSIFQISPCLIEPLLLKCQIIPALAFQRRDLQSTRMFKQVRTDTLLHLSKTQLVKVIKESEDQL